ncbi:MAG: redoxin domain-containing protein [Planctomycetes bacterium]|nr:redoxin domain-containing protein [Planctomycetota bacterium]
MVKARMGVVWVGGCLLLWGSAVPTATAAPTVAQMLSFQPKQEGVNCSTPTKEEQEACKVELVKGARPGSTGWLLRDPQGRPLRRFFDSNGDRQIDLLSYFQDGVEVYREIDSNLNGKIDQYRWLNAGGMKWGVDTEESDQHHITAWKMISPEEASQEVLKAVATRDLSRLQALWITDADLKALELPAAEVTRIQALRTKAAEKFQATCDKLALGDKTHWERLEAGPPQCVPAEQIGGKQDLIKYQHCSVLYENNGKHDWLPFGEMIQVGLAWRIIDAPGEEAGSGSGGTTNPELTKALDDLKAWDNKAPKGQDVPGPNADLVRYNVGRAELIEKILKLCEAKDRDQWLRQLADCLSAAAQTSPDTDKSAYEHLVSLEQQLAKDQPGTTLAAYVTFREMSADYATKLASKKDLAQIQEQWLTRLAKFVQDYPQGEDSPDALLQLGMGSEFLGKEAEAKKWYQQLLANFPDHPLAAKAKGAITRLEIEGKELQLVGPMAGGGQFDITSLRGKMVIVYYWASWNQQCVGDFARLKLLLNTYGSKGLELVCINLDNAPPEAGANQDRPPGTQLFQPAGLDSPLAVQYGVMVLPSLFLVDRDGKVLSRTVQIGTLEDEIKKLLK